MEQLSDPVKPKSSSYLLTIIVCAVISAGLIGLAYFLDNNEKAADFKPIPKSTAVDPKPDTPVTCDSKPMFPTDMCKHIGGLASGNYTYERQKQFQSEVRISREQQRLDELYTQEMSKQKQKYKYSLAANLSFPLFLVGGFFGIVALASLWLQIRSWWTLLSQKTSKGRI